MNWRYASNRPDNEFKPGRRMDEHTEKFSKKLEDIKKYQMELKTIITKKCTRRIQQIT